MRLWPVGTFNGVPEYMSGALADQAHNGTAATLSVRCLTTIPRTVAHAVPDVVRVCLCARTSELARRSVGMFSKPFCSRKAV